MKALTYVRKSFPTQYLVFLVLMKNIEVLQKYFEEKSYFDFWIWQNNRKEGRKYYSEFKYSKTMSNKRHPN